MNDLRFADSGDGNPGLRAVIIGQKVRDHIFLEEQGEHYQTLGGVVAHAKEVYRALGYEIEVICGMENTQGGLGVFENRYGTTGRSQSILRLAEPVKFLHDQLPATEIVHLGPLWSGDIDDSLYSLVRSSQVSIAVDVQGLTRPKRLGTVVPTFNPDMPGLIEGARFVKASVEEALVFTGTSRLSDAANLMLAWGHEEIVITYGKLGSRVISRSGQFTRESIRTSREIDPTGCGDVFFSAYCAKRVAGEDIESAVDTACLLASFAVSNVGVTPAALFEGVLSK